MTKENLLKYLRDPAYLHQISYQELKTLVAEHPNSLSLRYLLAVKSKQENNGDFDRQLAFLATYGIDRAHLFDIFNKEEELSLTADSVLLQEDYLELKELSALERELGAATLVRPSSTNALDFESVTVPNNKRYEDLPAPTIETSDAPTKKELPVEEDFYVLDFDADVAEEETNITPDLALSDTQVADNLAEIEELFKDLEEEEMIEEVPDILPNSATDNSRLLRETLISGTFSEIPLEIIETNVDIVDSSSTETGENRSDIEENTISIDYLEKVEHIHKEAGLLEALESTDQSNIVEVASQEAATAEIQEKTEISERSFQESTEIANKGERSAENQIKPTIEHTMLFEDTVQAPELAAQKEVTDIESRKAIQRITIFEQSTIIPGTTSLQHIREERSSQLDKSNNTLNRPKEAHNTSRPLENTKVEVVTEHGVGEGELATPTEESILPDYIISTKNKEQILEEEVITNKEESSLIPSQLEESLKMNPLPKSSFTTWYKQGTGNHGDFAGFDLVGFNSKGMIGELTENEVVPVESSQEELPKEENTIIIRKVISKADQSLVFEEDIASETLAQLLVLQGHYSKARAMYDQLSLIFPEKSSLFAGEIKKIENLEDEVT